MAHEPWSNWTDAKIIINSNWIRNSVGQTNTKASIICQQILCILIICSQIYAIEFNNLFNLMIVVHCTFIHGKKNFLFQPLTNRTVQVFVWFYKLNGIHFCTLAKTIKSATHTKHVKKHTKLFRMKEKEENKSKFNRVFLLAKLCRQIKLSLFEFIR